MGAALATRPRAENRVRSGRPPGGPGRRLVRDALARRDRRERLVLSLLLHDQMTPGEVAAALRLPPGEVTRTLSRVLSELAAAWEQVRRQTAAERRAPRRARRAA